MILLEKDAAQPLYAQLYQQLRSQILDGTMTAGDRLPSKRSLAAKLGLSVNTVEAAYHQLEAEGYVEARDRSGFYVLELAQLPLPPAAPAPLRAAPETSEEVLVDFALGAVDAAQFPMGVWQRLAKGCLATPEVLQRTPVQGDWGLRVQISDYLSRARGVCCDAAQILLGPGTDYLLSILSHILPDACTLAVENPVFNKAHRHFARMGHPVIPVEVDDMGVRLEQVETLDDVVLYTTPSHQYPLGFRMPMSRRTALLAWCQRGHFRYVIEDDYDSEFCYDARPLPSLQSIDRRGRVIYLGTLSGVIAPSLRISYMVLPPSLLEAFERVQAVFGCDVSTLEQLTLREFMAQGCFEKHLNRMRVRYRTKRQQLLQLFSPYEDRVQSLGAAAGSYLVVCVKGTANTKTLCAQALEHGVRVYPLAPYFIGEMPQRYERQLMLGFGSLTQTQMQQGVALLAQAWELGK